MWVSKLGNILRRGTYSLIPMLEEKWTNLFEKKKNKINKRILANSESAVKKKEEEEGVEAGQLNINIY